ncbi:hypothetical protein WJ58_12215 [Burkholderia ubonensis]|uniref:hypothetical protein n=1 Tax=Burkholderia ubonensis TaxID=101571 RepID=UPI0007583B37|nr:hypothetical protein [Burkholderia ubonensis]KVM57972.1 hypothetical protein WJ58_12215 [Burkholderia ubonensis]
MTGKVYMANVSASSATYLVNDSLIRTPARPMNPVTYAPYFVIVTRSRYGEPPGTFGMGENRFSAVFNDTIQPEPRRTDYTIPIPASYSIDDDLILYVYRNSVLLLTKRGVVIPTESA